MNVARRRAAQNRAGALVLALAVLVTFAWSAPRATWPSRSGGGSASTVAASSLDWSPLIWWRSPAWYARLERSSWMPTALTPEQRWLATPAARCVRWAESRDEYTIGGDEPHGGAWQFSVSTWQAKPPYGIGETGLPNEASPAVQNAAAYKLWRLAGWSQWQTAPGCGV